MKPIFYLLLFSLSSSSLTVEDVALKTERKLNSIQSIQANFQQYYYPSSDSTPLKEKGEFYFKKPDLMKWEYKDPEEKIFLYKEGVFLFYFPEDNELFQSSLSKEQYESEILSLLSGKKRLTDHYSIEFSPFPSENQKSWKLKLTPKEENEYIYILLEINEKTWLIQKAIFFDWAGSKSEFHFSQIKSNIRFPQNVFELKLPSDVEIIKDEFYQKNEYPQ